MNTAPLSLDGASNAELAGVLYAIDPARFGGAVLRGMPGPARDAWLAALRVLLPDDAAWRKLPVAVATDRLVGGLDFAATLDAGKPVYASGLLAQVAGGTLLLAMAERLEPAAAAIIAGALDKDHGAGATRAFGVIALDEGIEDDESLDPSLADRLAFHVELARTDMDSVAFDGWTCERLANARRGLPATTISNASLQALAGTALALGIDSARAGLFAVRAAKAIAALEGRNEVCEGDIARAAQLVFAHRAMYLPASEPPTDEPAATEREPDPGDAERDDTPISELQDVVIAATRAALPEGALPSGAEAQRTRRTTNGRGRSGAKRMGQKRGRPVGTCAADRAKDGRINLLATLKAALPWQRIRRELASVQRPLYLRKDDLQVTRFKDCNESTTVFVVDASGSQAAQRLGEVKGAIELLLAECYVRRDQVALVVFRGDGAEIVLAPTRALARAKKALAGIPAGGATPLSAGIDAARELVESIRRQGRTPRVVFLTDGRANVTRDGAKNPSLASSEALQTARLFRATGLQPVVVDSSKRPRASAEELAEAMDALYLPMPYASATAINAVVARHGRT